MTVDYIVASLPGLAFGAPAPISQEAFDALAPGDALADGLRGWGDLETQLRNAMAAARGGEKWLRPASGCSLYWQNRVTACFQEKDVAKRDELLTKAVTASVEEFDSVYDSYMEQYLGMGGQDIIDERIQKLAEIYGITYEAK